MTELKNFKPAPGGSSPSPENVELERAFLAALAQGPDQLGKQIRLSLTLCRQVSAQPAADPHTPPRQPTPLTTTEARLSALANMAEYFDDSAVRVLLRQVQQIKNAAHRLRLMIRLALRLPPQQYQTMINAVWQEAQTLADPADRADVLFQLTPLLALLHDEPTAPPAILEIVALAQAIGNTEARIRALIALSPHLPQSMRLSVLHRAIDEIDQLHNDTQRYNAIHALADHLVTDIESRALNSAQVIRDPAERARALTALARYLPITRRHDLRAAALDAISTIRDEEARAEALIAFVPHLEYVTSSETFPALLEQALGITIDIKKRALRARVLVTLAPHLTQDLQGEALAAVHGLTNEHERTRLLSELAPTLPPDMLVASLAVAHTMQAQDARATALNVLAHYVQDSARERTITDALAAASNLPHQYERITTLVDLLDILPDHLREQTLASSLETTRVITNESACARSLNLLGPHLPPDMMAKALETAHNINNPNHRLSALMGLSRHVPPSERRPLLNEMLDIVRSLPFEYRRARNLLDMAPLLDAPTRQQALDIAHQITDPFDRASVYIAYLPDLEAEPRRSLMIDAWKLIRQIENGYDAASALAALAPLLPETAGGDIARTAGMIVGSIMDEYDQASAISILAPMLIAEIDADNQQNSLPDRYAALEVGLQAVFQITDQQQRTDILHAGALLWGEITDIAQSYRLWQDNVQHITRLPLADALLCLSALLPVLRSLGGEKALLDIAHLLDLRYTNDGDARSKTSEGNAL